MRGRRPVLIVVLGALVLVAAALVGLLLVSGRQEPEAEAGEGRAAADGTGPRRRGARDEADEAPRSLALASAARAQRDRAARSGTLEGRVVDAATGEPVAEAELTFARGGTASSAMSSLAGDFLFRASEPGTYELAAVTAEGYLPYAPEWGHSPIRFTAREGVRVRDIVISLSPLVEYEGRVLDPEGRPVAGAEVEVLGTPTGQTALVPLSETVVTDEAGSFRFGAPDWALVEARKEGYQPARARVDRTAQITRRLEIRMRRGLAEGGDRLIAGVVVDDRGAPVAGALVMARFGFGPPGLHGGDQTVADEAGRFVLSGLDAGRYDVWATQDGLAPARARAVPSGVEDLRLVMPQGSTLSGTVTAGGSGEPVASFSIVIQRRLGPLAEMPYRTETIFDSEGHYEIGGIEPGQYAVFATAHGFAPADAEEVALRGAPGERARADFALGRGGVVSGVVTSAGSGDPVAGARVSLEARVGNEGSPVPVTATAATDEDGRFEMAGLAEGLRSIVVTAAQHHQRIVSGLQVREGGDVGPVAIELTPLDEGEEPELELTGIGAVLSVFRDGLAIRQVVQGGGAADAGLAPGDVVLGVDGVPALDLGFEGSIERIRGPEGSTVQLSVRRRGTDEEELVVVERRRIRS